MSSKSTMFGAAVVASALLLGACGGGSGGTSTAAESSDTPVERDAPRGAAEQRVGTPDKPLGKSDVAKAFGVQVVLEEVDFNATDDLLDGEGTGDHSEPVPPGPGMKLAVVELRATNTTDKVQYVTIGSSLALTPIDTKRISGCGFRPGGPGEPFGDGDDFVVDDSYATHPVALEPGHSATDLACFKVADDVETDPSLKVFGSLFVTDDEDVAKNPDSANPDDPNDTSLLQGRTRIVWAYN